MKVIAVPSRWGGLTAGAAVGVDLAAVELRALGLVGQYVIRPRDLGKSLRRLRIVLVLVGVQFLGELAVRGFDFRFACSLRNIQGGIGIGHFAPVAR